MTHEYILWIAMLVYGLKTIEEYLLDWRSWAVAVLKFDMTWSIFALMNGAVITLGVSCAAVGWSLPAYALVLPALMLINATFFHLLPFLRSRGRFSPGLITAVLLFYPIAAWAYYGAHLDGVLTGETVAVSFILAATLQAFPIILLRLRRLPYFDQTRVSGKESADR